MSLLELDGVSVSVGQTTVCRGIDLVINPGEVHVLFGPNGSGKSSLLSAVAGLSPFTLSSGTVGTRGQDITEATITERARAGIGIAIQNPPALAGVSISALAAALGATDRLEPLAQKMHFDDMLGREVNLGFSGGEVKRWEVLKLLLQQPHMCLFDEPESGVDVAAIAVIGNAISSYLAADPANRAALIITHTGFILEHVAATHGHMMREGTMVAHGDPLNMFADIRTHGYTV